jgi:AhpD family alkylhydroperoxidase
MLVDWQKFMQNAVGALEPLGEGNPKIMDGITALTEAGAVHGALDTKTRELIALAVAATTRCDTCIAIHAKTAAEAGAGARNCWKPWAWPSASSRGRHGLFLPHPGSLRYPVQVRPPARPERAKAAMDKPSGKSVSSGVGHPARTGPLEATMAARAAVWAVVIMTLLCGGCAFPAPVGMLLRADGHAADQGQCGEVAAVRDPGQDASCQAAAADSKDAYVRFARQVYVRSWSEAWSPAATTETALALAKAGDPAAREYLTIMVYDLQLQSAMEGVSLTAEDWHDIYVGSGIMTEAVFCQLRRLEPGGQGPALTASVA